MYTVAGYATCSFFQKAANVIVALEHHRPGAFKARVLEFSTKAEALKTMSEYIADSERQGLFFVLNHCLHARICMTYRKETVLLELALKPSHPALTMWESHMEPLFIDKHGGEKLQGLAPQGDLERLVQAELDNAQM